MAQYIVTVAKLNKRKAIPSTFSDVSSIVGVVHKGYTFEGTPVLPAAVPNPALGNWYAGADGYFYWSGGVALNAVQINSIHSFAAFDVITDDPPPAPAPLDTEKVINSANPAAAKEELNDQGFTNYMIAAFLQTATNTATVVSSRLPGKVGIDLIEQAYDLKGFQIKAKSCNWGPMGGFICQLPLFNKYGYDKIDFNAVNILHYLACLDKFSGQKTQLSAIEAKLTTAKAYLDGLKEADIISQPQSTAVFTELTKDFTADGTYQVTGLSFRAQITAILISAQVFADKIKAIRDVLNKAFNQNLYAIIDAYRTQEKSAGDWSGENTIETAEPFISLKRKFDVNIDATVTSVKLMPGVVPASVVKVGNNIYGQAGNVVNENIAFDITNSTVMMDFLLVQDGTSAVWAIYHGEIFYKKTAADQNNPYVPGEQGTDIPPDILSLFPDTTKKYSIVAAGSAPNGAIALKNKGFLESIARFAVVPVPIQLTVAVATAPFSTVAKSFYPIQGFVNPHPPYKLAGADYYKNAVSGDYDTFAYWPASTVQAFELVRLSEKLLSQSLKLYTDDSLLFGIEFIPGFSELNPTDASPWLKESAEVGNVNDIGDLVSGTLNSVSRALLKQDMQAKATYFIFPPVNKAFHSDEGGRPGVMEIEFPIAVFFPETIESIALNNLYNYIPDQPAAIPVFAGRKATNALGGLIKTPEEFLQLMLELNTQANSVKKYTVLVQAEWMIHLSYISLPTQLRNDFLGMTGSFSDFFIDLQGRNSSGEALTNPDTPDPVTRKTPKQAQLDFISKKLADFRKIDTHHLEIYPIPTDFNQPNFAVALQRLLKLTGKNNAFNYTRKQFLKLAFQSNRAAQKRMFETMQVIFNLG